MRLDSLVPPPYLPDPEQDTVLELGLRPLAARDWLAVDADFARFNAHKRQQGRRRLGQVWRAEPGSEAAQAEFGRTLLGHLLEHHGDRYVLAGGRLRHRPSGLDWPARPPDLWHSALWIQEDVCLMEEAGGGYALTAASVCSPTNWRLEEKIGRGADAIHGPVPGYARALGPRVNRLLAGLRPGRPVLRFNWSVQAGNELFGRKDPDDGEPDHWRVERQTLARLPETGAVVFGIRIFLHSFERMAACCDFKARYARLRARLPGAQRAYKRL